MNFSAINIQGNVISLEMLDKIRHDDQISWQSARDFGFPKGTILRDQIGSAWQQSRAMWKFFKARTDALPEGDFGTSETRKLWMVPLLMSLGYDVDTSSSEVIAGKSYAVSHRDAKLDKFPVLIMGPNDDMDRKPAGNRLRMSPHALMQEYLNNTDHLYGLVSNGRFLRLLRNSTRLARLAYLEFDLQKMMEEELYNEFALMFRVLHASRMPQTREKAEECIFEQYHQDSMDAGSRIRTKLRIAVKEAMQTMANGFILHPNNYDFVQQIRDNQIEPSRFYRLLLRSMYRIIFLATIEERDLVFPEKKATDEGYQTWLRYKRMYYDYYSLERLRKLAFSPSYIDPQKNDLWQSLLTTFRLFEPLNKGEKVGIQPLGGTLFGAGELSDEVSLYDLSLSNEHTLQIIGKLTSFRAETGERTRVNYRDLDVEELGSVYEALLELHPYFYRETAATVFAFTEGSEQKLTGSYYTRHDLVAQLIKTALMPVIRERLAKGSTPEEQEKELLDIRVCDPSSGSGHFLIAAARTIGFELARVRSGEDNPGDQWVQQALRDVIQYCIYGVDKNPAAVELCRISLWLVGHNSGKPLTFLEHKIKRGDSLIGVDRMERLDNLIPNEAFKAVSGDEKSIANAVKKQNRNFLKSRQFDLFQQQANWSSGQQQLAERFESLNTFSVESIDDYATKQRRLDELSKNPDYLKKWRSCNLFTYAFYQPYSTKDGVNLCISSKDLALYLSEPAKVSNQLIARADGASALYHFFHWPLEFPDITQQGGFDVILTNPPWERIKLQEKEFFTTRDKDIANAPNAAARKKKIKQLSQTNPELAYAYEDALHEGESASRFIRDSQRYPLTGRGDINTYSIFSELIKDSLNEDGQAGFVVPTGIATDDTNKFYFADLMEQGKLVSLFDFENRKAIFQGVHRSYKFCLLTLGSADTHRKSQFGFFLHDVLDLQDKRRVFSLGREDFLNINPNTKTTPIFRTRKDAELTAEIYSRVPVLINEGKGQNPWGISFSTMFHMSNDSGLFRTEKQMVEAGFELKGNRFVKGDEIWLPLYSGRLYEINNHRAASYSNQNDKNDVTELDKSQLQDPCEIANPWYWVKENGVDTHHHYHFSFRNNARATDIRTFITSIIPRCGVGNNSPILTSSDKALNKSLLYENSCSLVFDFFTRIKAAGLNLNFFYVKQFTAIPKECYQNKVSRQVLINSIELNYTSWDIKAFADDLWKEADEELQEAITRQWEDNKKETHGYSWSIPDWHTAYPEIAWNKEEGCPLPPFKWDENRRARLRAELDAQFALLYGLERDDLRYILDPQDVYGEEYPGETFRVLKNKEIRKHGEYRTRRLILEAYDRLRPNWNMEAHLEKMKEVWEGYQVDRKADSKVSKAEKPKKQQKTIAKQQQRSIFDELPIKESMLEFGLHTGIYTVRDTVNVINSVVEKESAKVTYDKVNRWFKDLADINYQGIGASVKEDIDNLKISFHGLIELYVIGTLREAGFSLRKVILARESLSEKTGKIYPFATNNVRDNLKVAGRTIIFTLPNGEKVSLDGTSQLNLDLIKHFFRDIKFDTDGIAQRIIPEKGENEIIIDPKFCGGKPAVESARLEVETVYAFIESGETKKAIMDGYDLSEKAYNAVLKFIN